MAFSWKKRLLKQKESATRADPELSPHFPLTLASVGVHKPDIDLPDIYLNREVLPVEAGQFLEIARPQYPSVIVKVSPGSFRESKQVSLAAPLAEVLGYERTAGGISVNLAKVESEGFAFAAEEVELSFKDQNVSRGDMWRLGQLIPA